MRMRRSLLRSVALLAVLGSALPFAGCASTPKPRPLLPMGTVSITTGDGVLLETEGASPSSLVLGFDGKTAAAEVNARLLVAPPLDLSRWDDKIRISRQDGQYVLYVTLKVGLEPMMALDNPRIAAKVALNRATVAEYVEGKEVTLPVVSGGYRDGRVQLKNRPALPDRPKSVGD
jgi:hypothetical protein